MDTILYDLEKFQIILDKNDHDVSQQIINFGWYEDEKFVTKIFSKYLSKGMTVLDLGGNIGFYTLLARSIVGSQGKIITFEPFPNNVKLIKESIKINHFENIKVEESAVSNTNGTTTLFLSPDHNSEHSLIDFHYNHNIDTTNSKITVNVSSLDSYFEKNVKNKTVDFIKMDIEGSEYYALDGMKDIIRHNKSLTLLSEFYPKGMIANKTNPEKFLEYLEVLEFSIYHIDDLENKLYAVSPKELMSVYQDRENNSTDPYTQKWGWHTNILAKK